MKLFNFPYTKRQIRMVKRQYCWEAPAPEMVTALPNVVLVYDIILGILRNY